MVSSVGHRRREHVTVPHGLHPFEKSLSLSLVLATSMDSARANDGIETTLHTSTAISAVRSKVEDDSLGRNETRSETCILTRSDDVMELFKHADQKSDQVHLKIQERQRSRQFFECIAETIDDMIDTVCSSLLSK